MGEARDLFQEGMDRWTSEGSPFDTWGDIWDKYIAPSLGVSQRLLDPVELTYDVNFYVVHPTWRVIGTVSGLSYEQALTLVMCSEAFDRIEAVSKETREEDGKFVRHVMRAYSSKVRSRILPKPPEGVAEMWMTVN